MHAEGEALTNDEVMELLRNQEMEKRAKKKGKQRRKVQEPQPTQSPENSDDDTNHSFKCGGAYLDTKVREWVGCDTCMLQMVSFQVCGFQKASQEVRTICVPHLPKLTT